MKLNIDIVAWMREDTHTHAEIRQYLGQINSPGFGVRMVIGLVPIGKDGLVPVYRCVISGKADLEPAWVQGLLQAIANCDGMVKQCSVYRDDPREKIEFKPCEPQKHRYVGIYEVEVDDSTENYTLDDLKNYLSRALHSKLSASEGFGPAGDKATVYIKKLASSVLPA